MSLLFITHDLGVVAEMAHRVVVMYSGQKVEEARVADLFNAPRHPYTQGLMEAVPKPDHPMSTEFRLFNIPGVVPHPLHLPPGCRFAARCAYAKPDSAQTPPQLDTNGAGHAWRCHHPLSPTGA